MDKRKPLIDGEPGYVAMNCRYVATNPETGIEFEIFGPQHVIVHGKEVIEIPVKGGSRFLSLDRWDALKVRFLGYV